MKRNIASKLNLWTGSVRFVKYNNNNNSDVIRFCLLDQIINCKDLTQKNECFMNQTCRSSSESVSYTKEPVCECIIQTGFGKLIHCKNPSKRNTNKTCRSQSCTQGPDQPESWINHSNWINWFIAKTKMNCFVHKLRKADYLVDELNRRTKSDRFVNWIKQITKQIWWKNNVYMNQTCYFSLEIAKDSHGLVKLDSVNELNLVCFLWKAIIYVI